MDMEGSVNSRINGGIQRYFSLFLSREMIAGPLQAQCLDLFRKIKALSETLSDCLIVLESRNVDEGRLALLESSLREYKATFLRPTTKVIQEITGQKID